MGGNVVACAELVHWSLMHARSSDMTSGHIVYISQVKGNLGLMGVEKQ